MSDHENLVENLVAELRPVTPAPATGLLAAGWLLFSAFFVVLVTHLLGPLRPAAVEQFLNQPRFTLEMLTGVLAAVALAVAAFRSASPEGLSSAFIRFTALVSLLWAGGFAVGLFAPALEPSMAGKRDHCLYETFLLGMLPLVGALYWQRRLYALRPVRAALLAGLAAGILPALYMQMACMYEPLHILKFHLGPGLMLALSAPLLLRALGRLGVSDG